MTNFYPTKVGENTYMLSMAGVSDKYGQIFIERMGLTGFTDTKEPVALFRAQDLFSLDVLHAYQTLLDGEPRVLSSQHKSVERQIAEFRKWRRENYDKIRIPGTHANS